jgi:hypothetical protein
MRDLLLVVPSRGRPYNADRLIGKMRDTCTGDTTLLLGLDADDPQLPLYKGLRGIAKGDTPILAEMVIRDGLRQVVAWLNELAVPRAGEYRFVGHIGDDNVPVTPGWDVQLMDALDKTPFAFGNDLNPNRPPGSLACHIFMRSEVITALGYMGPPCLRHMYVDNVWTTWGLETGMTYLHETVLEHRHPSTGGAAHDDSYASSEQWMSADGVAFGMYCGSGALAADIRKIKALL